MSKTESICARCKKFFIDYAYRQRKYCSKECFLLDKRNQVTLQCEFCGQDFKVIKSRLPRAQYCSKSCRAKAQAASGKTCYLRGTEHPNWQGPVTVQCAYCSVYFSVSRGYFNQAMKRNQKRFYCSDRCRLQSYPERHSGSKNPNYKGNISVVLTCDRCGSIFEIPKHQYQQGLRRSQKHRYCSYECRCPGPVIAQCFHCGKDFEMERKFFNLGQKRYYNHFCSSECQGAWLSSRTGPDSTNWQGGTSFEPYTPEFNNQLRKSIRERDSFCCQLCNMTEQESLEQLGRVLSTHHIDYDKHNSVSSNLIALCEPCHRKTQKRRKYYKALFQAASANQ